jgi:hypothetical protein
MIVRVALTGNNAFPSFGIPLGGSLPPVWMCRMHVIESYKDKDSGA